MTRRRAILLIATLIALSFGVYGNSLPNSYQLDDLGSIVDNSAVQRGDIPGAAAFWPGRALVYTSFALQIKLHGDDPAGLRIVNILAHAMAAAALAWLLYGLLRRAVPGRDPLPAAGLAALFFLLHPLQTQAVAYVVQRAASWATLFSLLGVAAYVHSLRAERAAGWRAMSVLSLLLAMLCKEFAIITPFIVLLAELEFGERRGRLRRLLPVAATVVVVPLIAATGNSFGEFGSDSLVAQSQRVGRLDYFLTQLEVTARYGGLTLLPWRQNVDHDVAAHSSAAIGAWLPWLIPHLLVAAGAIFARRRGHGVAAFAVAFAYLSLAPESSFFPIFDLMFEHRAYMGLGGAAMLFGLLAARAARDRPRLAWPAAGLLLLALTAATVARNQIWRTPESLWADAVAKSPEKGRPRYALGVAYAEQGRLNEAKEQFELAIRYSPNSARAWTNLGKAHLALGDGAEATRCFQHILDRRPDHVSAWYHLGVAHDRAGSAMEARTAYQRALELEPENTSALNGLAAIELRLGNRQAALRHAEEAARLGAPAARLLQAIRSGG